MTEKKLFVICNLKDKCPNNLEKNRAKSIMRIDFGLHYKAIVIKTVWFRHKNRHKKNMEQNREPTN